MARSLTQFTRALKSVRIQGAMAAARATLQAVAGYARALPRPRTAHDWAVLDARAQALAAVRPTEPLARNVARWFVRELASFAGAARSAREWPELTRRLECALLEYLEEIDGSVVKTGERLVHSKQTIFTHCHSSVAEHVLVAAHRAGKRFKVYHTETRPLFQGHTTDRRLRQAKIPTTMVADSAAAFLISNHSGDNVRVSWVLLGADSIARDGAVLNKIGSFGIALAAHDSKVPVYVAAPLLKVDWQGLSTFELRSAGELWPRAPKGTKVLNFAFDRVPPAYITGLITEFGILKPSQVLRVVKQHYPWIIGK